MSKVKTIKVSGGDYAKVADRLKLFWEDNPDGKIDSERENLADGKVRFIARIWRDSSEILELARTGVTADVIKMTANATASADAVKGGDKENEKLETVAVGRALAMLGYLASGEVASREEMEEFEKFKNDKQELVIESAIDMIYESSSMAELQKVWSSLGTAIQDERVQEAKNKQKEALSENTPITTK